MSPKYTIEFLQSNILNNIKEGATNWEIDGFDTGIPKGAPLEICMSSAGSWSQVRMYNITEGAGAAITVTHGPDPNNLNLAYTTINPNDTSHKTEFAPTLKFSIPSGAHLSLAVYKVG